MPGTYDDWGLGRTESATRAQSNAPQADSPEGTPQYTPPAYRAPTAVSAATEESTPLQLWMLISGALNLVLMTALIWKMLVKHTAQYGRDPAQESVQQYIRDGLEQGYPIDQLQKALLRWGWPQEQVQQAIMMALSPA